MRPWFIPRRVTKAPQHSSKMNLNLRENIANLYWGITLALHYLRAPLHLSP